VAQNEPVGRSDSSASWKHWLIVAMFLLAYIFSFADRMILGLMVEPLKRDLLLTDTQISLLQGVAFAVFYTLAGLPLGRVIDRMHRPRIAAVGIALWSAMTALSGLAQNYVHLLLARMGVGIGEATLSPAAYSLFADLFDRRRLGTALGIYNFGTSIGAGLAMILGGAIVQFSSSQYPVVIPLLGVIRPWQQTFFYLGLPGLLVALMFLWIPESKQRAASTRATATMTVREVVSYAWGRRSALTPHHLGVAFSVLASFAIISWMPVMLVRVHGWGIAQAGLAVGLALLVGGVIGLAGGGWLSDRWHLRERTAGRMRLSGYASLLGIPAAAVFALQSGPLAAVGLFCMAYICSILPVSAAGAALQELVPAQIRGQMSAFYLFVINLIGIGLGSTAVALLSDRVFTDPQGVRYSLAVVAPIALALAALCYFVSLGPVRRAEAD